MYASWTTKLIVGLFALAGIAALAILSLRLGKIELLSNNGYIVYANFDNISGLKTGDQVEIAGVQVGKVVGLGLKDYRAHVDLRINKGVQIDTDAIAFVVGGVQETTELLEQKYDHILYTGNGTVGRIVAAAAAKHLTPTTLELGGKSPAIVDRDANLKQAASRIAFAKWSNAGQTCIAVDHVWVHRDVHDELVQRLTDEIHERYGDDPRKSEDFGRIVNSRHAARIQNLMDSGGYDQIATGGTIDIDDRYVAPTVVTGVKPNAALMSEEIFGPVLPVLSFDDIAEPISHVSASDHPLALYVFSKNNSDRVLDQTTSGGACVNDTMMHIFPPSLPFGGVGESGYGA